MLHIEYAVRLPGHGQAFYLRSMVDLRKHDHYSGVYSIRLLFTGNSYMELFSLWIMNCRFFK